MTVLVLILNIAFSPVQMQEFPTRESCQMAKEYIVGKLPQGTVKAAACAGE